MSYCTSSTHTNEQCELQFMQQNLRCAVLLSLLACAGRSTKGHDEQHKSKHKKYQSVLTCYDFSQLACPLMHVIYCWAQSSLSVLRNPFSES
jgi:hypothetical protein